MQPSTTRSSANRIFRIQHGEYEFAVDRTNLTVRLAETRSGIVWADFDVLLGVVVLRSAAGNTTHSFGDARLVSVSEKSSADGKRILFGLDLFGVPIDAYLTCTSGEIQLTVEASRDTRQFSVESITLLPGLCSVPRDGRGRFVVGAREGEVVPVEAQSAAHDSSTGLWRPTWTLPAFAAVRAAPNGTDSMLAIFTDSAYATLHSGAVGDLSNLQVRFSARDPDRRRLDLRIVPVPDTTPFTLATLYRERVLALREHVSLRRKIRKFPTVEKLIGAPLIFVDHVEDVEGLTIALRGVGVDSAMFLFRASDAVADSAGFRAAARALQDSGYLVGVRVAYVEDLDLAQLAATTDADALCLETDSDLPAWESIDDRWAAMDSRLALLRRAKEYFPIVGKFGESDWSAMACDFWIVHRSGSRPDSGRRRPLPIVSAVYHDSLVTFGYPALHPRQPRRFLRALLNASPPTYHIGASCFTCSTVDAAELRSYVAETAKVLSDLHRRTLGAFVTSHHFLSDDGLVEETRWSNGIVVRVNQSDSETFRDATGELAPLQFAILESSKYLETAAPRRAVALPVAR